MGRKRSWMEDEDRVYPVRIDPGQYIPSNEFILAMASQGQSTRKFSWDGPAYVGDVYDSLKNCRLYIAFNENNCPTLLQMFQVSGAQVSSASLDMTH